MTDEPAASTIRSMTEAAKRARDFAGARTVRFTAFGRIIEVSYPAIADFPSIALGRAFRDQESSDSPDARITLVDSIAAGPPPEIPWPKSWLGPFGNLRGRYAGAWSLAADNDSGCLSAFDPGARDAAVWCKDASRLPYWVRATPFRIPLSWIAHTFGGEMIHGAGVVVHDRAVLLLGPGGAGKSTLALAAAQHGFSLLGDDFLMVCGLQAQAIYRRVKAHDDTMERLSTGPSIGQVLNAAALAEKRILDLDESLLYVEPVPIGALVIPHIGASAKASRISPPELLRRVVAPSMQGLLGGSGMTLKVLADLARRVPAYELVVGPDIRDNVQALAAIADTASDMTLPARSGRESA